MGQFVAPTNEAPVDEMHSRSPRKKPAGFSSLGLRTRCILAGILAAAILTMLIALGSRGFHWFDAALIGYAVATIFAIAAVTYKYSFWLARPPTGRYWRRSWQLFFSYENFRRRLPFRSLSGGSVLPRLQRGSIKFGFLVSPFYNSGRFIRRVHALSRT